MYAELACVKPCQQLVLQKVQCPFPTDDTICLRDCTRLLCWSQTLCTCSGEMQISRGTPQWHSSSGALRLCAITPTRTPPRSQRTRGVRVAALCQPANRWSEGGCGHAQACTHSTQTVQPWHNSLTHFVLPAHPANAHTPKRPHPDETSATKHQLSTHAAQLPPLPLTHPLKH